MIDKSFSLSVKLINRWA